MIVTNVATNSYRKGQTRLKNSLGDVRSLMFDHYPVGCPTHKDSPYEFKIYAIEEAFEKDPIVLWADASMVLVGDIKRIEEKIINDGYFFEEAGHYVDTWCNAHTRKYFNLAEGNGYTMFSAGLMGLNLKSELAMEFFYKWKESARHGCFSGDWKDHRHDMTCASIIACRMGMKYQTGGSHMAYIGPGYSTPNKDVVFHCVGL